ncbi:MAG: SDR family oxidoreductase [Dehalococcoidia bacterium]
MGLLDNKNAIITGGSRGIGKSIACYLAKENCNVSIIGRTRDEVNSTVDELKNYNVESFGYIGDQSSEDFVVDTIKKINKEFKTIDILINNAAVGMRYITESSNRFIHNMPTDDWKRIIDINLNGVMYFSREVLKTMRKQSSGKIVMISSGLGRKGYLQYGPYSASKFAMEAMMQIIALENANKNIFCNSVAPGGLTNSSEKFLGKMNKSKLDEILPANICDDIILFLATENSSGINGQALTAKEWNKENNITIENLRNRLI